MWSNNKACSVAAVMLAACMLASPVAWAGGGEIEITEGRKKACVEAQARFEKLYPDFRPESGVVIVKLYKYNFCPGNLTVKPGTKVRWVNVDRRTSHSVWLKDAGLEESQRMFPEEIWEHTFTKSGAYPYLCGPHWKQEDMRGFVKVVE